MKKEAEVINGEIERVSIHKAKNGYVVSVTTEAEEYDMVCVKRIHVVKLIKELFKE
jgi:hypothetical protein